MTLREYDRARIDRNLRYMSESPLARRCVTCRHLRHNELGYCQVGQCSCEDGRTIEGIALMIRRDLGSLLKVKGKR